MTFSPKPTTPPPGITKKTAKLITLEDLNNISPPPTTESQRKGIDPKLLDHITGGRDLSGEVFDKAFMAEFRAASERKGTPLFEARPASEWLTLAQAKPRPLMLFDSMWYQGDLCILFADTNVGKSILAVQIADSISRGIPIPGLELDAPAQPVAYLDFEMSDRQFLTRYSYEGSDPYPFSPGFVRLEQSMGVDYLEWGFTSFEAFLYHQMGHYIERTGTKVLIVDNLTFLHSETEKAKDASRLMNVLTDLKRKHDLSLLILAHTPKRDNSKPLEVNHPVTAQPKNQEPAMTANKRSSLQDTCAKPSASTLKIWRA